MVSNIKYHLYDFNTNLERDKFDISQCFKENRIEFAIRFNYPQGVGKLTRRYNLDK
jgi:hypothetical protein